MQNASTICSIITKLIFVKPSILHNILFCFVFSEILEAEFADVKVLSLKKYCQH